MGLGVVSCQMSVVSCQLSVVRCQLSDVSRQSSVFSCQSAAVRGGMGRGAVGAAGRQPGAKAAVDAAVDGSLRSLKSLRSLRSLTTTDN